VSGIRKISVAGDGSSVLRDGPNSIDIIIESFSNWARSSRATHIDLFKVNIEGAEFALLAHLIETGLIAYIENLQIQFHDFVDDADRRMRMLTRQLRKTHLPTYRYRYVWENWRRRKSEEHHNLELRYGNLKNAAGVLDPDFVRELAEALGLQVFIETGTYRGGTLGGVLQDFETLVSIELDPALHAAAVQGFADHPNVRLLHGDSAERLAEAFDLAGGRAALVWLDAHCSGPGTSRAAGNTPIVREIEILLSRAGPRDVVMIDDLRCFTTPLPGFEWDPALAGYPSAPEIARRFADHKYQVVVMCDALIAIPHGVLAEVKTTPVLSACTQLRLGTHCGGPLCGVESTIAKATGGEAEALLDLPEFLSLHQRYGLGGDYFYWRSLIGETRGLDSTAADREFAKKCGIHVREKPSFSRV